MSRPAHHRFFALLLLLAFLFSTNALAFAGHAVEKMAHGAENFSSADTPFSAPLEHHHHTAPAEGHHGSDCCGSYHSHASLLCQPSSLAPHLSVSSLTFFEPFTYIPEVFLDRFIPPQNLA